MTLGYFAFLFAGAVPDERALVVFSSTQRPLTSDAISLVKDHCDWHPTPKRILFLVSWEPESVTAINAELGDQIRGVTSSRSPPIVLVHRFDKAGHADGLPSELVDLIVRQGMTEIFRRRGGMLEGNTTHHYRKPSRKHADKFIRAGNAIVDGAETDFIAFALLRRVHPEAEVIYTDTGAINSVGLAFGRLRSTLGGTSLHHVSSFGSYEGLSRFRFELPSKSVVLISASTSGELVTKITAKDSHFGSGDRVLTLFQLSTDSEPNRSVLCDLRKDAIRNPLGFDPIRSGDDARCSMCQQGSVAIDVVGDNFLPEGVRFKRMILRAAHLPAATQKFISEWIGHKAIRAMAFRAGKSAREIHFDVATAMNPESPRKIKSFIDRLNWACKQGVPTATEQIVSLGDDGSQAIATHVQASLKRMSARDVPIHSPQDLQNLLSSERKVSGATIVTAGASASGRAILALSLLLRNLSKDRAIVYIIGLARASEEAVLNELKSNLSFGDQAGDFPVLIVRSISVPGSNRVQWISWQDELEWLRRRCEELGALAGAIFEKRIATIANDANGIADQLFWPNCRDEELVIRDGFAFFPPGYDCALASQADVYFAVAMALYGLRREEGSTGFGGSARIRNILSPRCFDRFNDGIVQAALLRAATPNELDYSVDADISEEMSRIVAFIFNNAHLEAGEAAMEFAVALAMGKLQLCEGDRARMIGLAAESPDPRLALVFQ